MKKQFLLLLLSLWMANSLFAQEPKNLTEYVFKAGDILVYEVSKGGKTYRLTVTLTGKTFIDSKIVDDITFDWASSEDTARKGSVAITKDARTNATTYQPYLLPGRVTLKNKCTLWLSFMDLSQFFSRDGREMDLGDGSKKQYKIVEGGGEKYSFIFKGTPAYIGSFKATSASGHFLNFCPTHNSNGLIVLLNIGWIMKLKEVK